MGHESISPEPSKAQTQREFVALLRQLKIEASLTYRQIESRTTRQGYRLARSTIAAALERDWVPREEVVDGIVRACGQDPAPWLTARRRLVRISDASPSSAFATVSTPRQLPLNVRDFVGRRQELALLARLVADRNARGGVVVISGPAGCGKSALGVQGARLVSESFPDGQLYLDLQGMTPGCCPLSTHEIVVRLLRALGVDDTEAPPTTAEAATLLREVVADRRILMVLDNAASVGQIRPIVHVGSCTVALVTSRIRMASLADSGSLPLQAFSGHQAVALLERLLGTERANREQGFVIRLADLCGRLPLVLRVAAARLVARPAWPIKELVERLENMDHRLDVLRVDDLDVRASLGASWNVLLETGDEAAARVFRLLGTLPLQNVNVASVARPLALSSADANGALERLVDLNLIEHVDRGCYRVSDLVWLLAREQAQESPHPEDLAACRRSTRRV